MKGRYLHDSHDQNRPASPARLREHLPIAALELAVVLDTILDLQELGVSREIIWIVGVVMESLDDLQGFI